MELVKLVKMMAWTELGDGLGMEDDDDDKEEDDLDHDELKEVLSPHLKSKWRAWPLPDVRTV